MDFGIVRRVAPIWLISAAIVWAGMCECTESRVGASFRDNLEFTSEDGSYGSRIGGLLIVHYRDVSGLPEGPRRPADSFFLRQARLEISGTARRYYEFRVQSDFSTGTASGVTGTMLDGYLGWTRFPEFSMRFGQFKEPFSSEETDSIKFIDFADRSDLNRLVPARDIGMMVYGRLIGGMAEYEAGYFNGQGRGIADENDEKEGAVRLALKPVEGLRLAVAGTVGQVDAGSINGLDLSSKMLGVKFLDAVSGSINGRRDRLSFELAYNRGPAGVRGEWVGRRDRVEGSGFYGRTVQSSAWFTAATWFLTGEEKTPGKRIRPLKPFDPATRGWGAFELAIRAGELAMDGDLFSLGVADPSSSANRMFSVAAGFNWFPESNLRVTPNVVFEKYNSAVEFSPFVKEGSATGMIVRLQADF